MANDKTMSASASDDRPLLSAVSIALVDMDGTLCDCADAIARGLAELRGPVYTVRW